jgi:ParB family chromosome partitioning protein
LLCSEQEQQLGLLAAVLREGLSVRQTEARAKRMARDVEDSPPERTPDADILALQDRLREMLSTKVELHHGPKGGRMVIHYYSNEELEALTRRIAEGTQ